MNKTRVVNLNNEPYDVYIGRKNNGMHYGNPFDISMGREECISCYKDWLLGIEKYKNLDPTRRNCCYFGEIR